MVCCTFVERVSGWLRILSILAVFIFEHICPTHHSLSQSKVRSGKDPSVTQEDSFKVLSSRLIRTVFACMVQGLFAYRRVCIELYDLEHCVACKTCYHDGITDDANRISRYPGSWTLLREARLQGSGWPDCIYFRVHVVYNAETALYVLWVRVPYVVI